MNAHQKCQAQVPSMTAHPPPAPLHFALAVASAARACGTQLVPLLPQASEAVLAAIECASAKLAPSPAAAAEVRAARVGCGVRGMLLKALPSREGPTPQRTRHSPPCLILPPP